MHNSFWFQVVVGACAVFVGNRVEPRVKKRVTNIVMAWIVTFAITVVVTLGVVCLLDLLLGWLL
ncbi:MAG: hypothetical protein HFJ95_07685 [Muribaculaceae bacterium]|jgi:phosphate/sulfate permease|nr:hypothetical protein [Muribaculaceae bacterium]